MAIGISGLLMINTISFSVAEEVTNFYRNCDFQIWFWTWPADRGTESLLRTIDGVDSTYGIYTANFVEITNLNDRINLLHGTNPHKHRTFGRSTWTRPSSPSLTRGARSCSPTTLKERLQVQKGDLLTLKMERGERQYQVIGFFDSLMWNGSFGLIAERYLKMDMNKQYYDDLFIKTNKDPHVVSAAIKNASKEEAFTFKPLIS